MHPGATPPFTSCILRGKQPDAPPTHEAALLLGGSRPTARASLSPLRLVPFHGPILHDSARAIRVGPDPQLRVSPTLIRLECLAFHLSSRRTRQTRGWP